MPRLDVRIIAARNLPDPQVFGMPDPYVKVKLENQKHKTSVIENSVNPRWDEVFKFQIADENSSQLKMELWNSNVLKDDFLGEYVLSLSGLYRGVERDEWLLLKQCKTNSEIHVKILAVDFGLLPPAGTPAVTATTSAPVAPAPMPVPAVAPVPQPQYVAPPPAQPQYAPPAPQPQYAQPAPAPYGAPPQPQYVPAPPAPYGAPQYAAPAPMYAAPAPPPPPPPPPGPYGAPGYAPQPGYPVNPGYPQQPGYPPQQPGYPNYGY
jgi:hypothetical protein